MLNLTAFVFTFPILSYGISFPLRVLLNSSYRVGLVVMNSFKVSLETLTLSVLNYNLAEYSWLQVFPFQYFEYIMQFSSVLQSF